MMLRRAAPTLLAVLAALGLAHGLAQSQPVREPAPAPMVLGAAANFSQGWSEQTFAAAQALGLREYRDAIVWSQVEQVRGEYRFNSRRAQYPARLAEGGARLVLTVSGGNPLYDDGDTPHSPEAVAAFARFVAAVVREYPAVSAIEIGNEFNSGDFVTGPVRAGGIAQRARYHLALVRAVAGEVRQIRPDMPILGGATHSLPAGYLWSVLGGAGAGLLDGLAVHPYTTPIDQLPAQVAVLRRNPAARAVPLYVTEWGTRDMARAPDHLMRGYAAMASLGFARLDWYPLNERGDNMAALIARDGSVTAVGEAFRFVSTTLAPFPAHDISPDPFTFAHAFGQTRLVLWGEPRPLTLARDDIAAFDARGRPLPREGLMLDAARAVVLVSSQPIHLGSDVILGCNPLVADSFYQFAFPDRGMPPAAGFSASVTSEGGERPLITLPGQQRGGVPWMPYLGLRENPATRLTAERIVLGGGAAGLVQRWDAPAGGPFRIEVTLTPMARNRAPIRARITQGRTPLWEQELHEPARFEGEIATGQTEFRVSSTNAEPAAADYRIRMFDDLRCRNF